MWYRIELNKDRSVSSCVEVESGLKSGKSVHYVEADTKIAAIEKLATQFDQIVKRRAAVLADQVKRGLCKVCAKSRGPEGTSVWCRPCADRKALNRRQLRRGERAPRPKPKGKTPEEKAAYILHHRQKSRTHEAALDAACPSRRTKEVRVKWLRVVLGEYRARTPEAFESWLVSQISGLTEELAKARSDVSPAPKAGTKAPSAA